MRRNGCDHSATGVDLLLDHVPFILHATWPGLLQPVRAAAFALLLGGVSALGGCAGGLSEAADGGLNTGTLPPSRVVLTDAERNATCVAIETTMQAQAARINALERSAEAERKAAAPTLARTFARVFGPADSDNKAVADLRHEQIRLDAFNELLADKGCGKIDTIALVQAPAARPPTAASQGAAPLPPPSPLDGLEQVVLPRGY